MNIKVDEFQQLISNRRILQIQQEKPNPHYYNVGEQIDIKVEDIEGNIHITGEVLNVTKLNQQPTFYVITLKDISYNPDN